MKQTIWQKIEELYKLIVRKLHGHKYDCCGHIRMNCKRCPFNTDEVKEILKNRRDRGYIELKKGDKK